MIHFSESEFFCPCGCGLNFDQMDEDFIRALDLARGYAEVPFILNSSIRCPDHNIVAGGSDTSSHLYGLAADIRTTTAYVRYRVIYGLLNAGFTRIGIGDRFIHGDRDPNKPKELIWGYYGQ